MAKTHYNPDAIFLSTNRISFEIYKKTKEEKLELALAKEKHKKNKK